VIDIHSHVWEGHHYSDEAKRKYREAYGDAVDFDAPPEAHWAAVASRVDRAAVYAMMMGHVGLEVPNDYVYAYVSQHPDKLVGVASVDPHDPECCEQIEHAVRQQDFRALKLSGAYQNFDPSNVAYDELYRTA